MIKWTPLTAGEQLETVASLSKEKPCLIFKHSSRCSLSSIALHRLESNWDFTPEDIEPFFLDLIRFRQLSQQVAETFEVYHESPQVILIRDGESTYDASHLDISVSELRECFEDSL